MIKFKSIISVATTFIIIAMSGSAWAQMNDSNVVNVCNKGNVDVSYLSFSTKSSFFGGEEAEVSGWYKIRPGRCQDVNMPYYDTVAVGFLQKNKQGVRGNPVYSVQNADRPGGGKWSPTSICVPPEKAVTYKNTYAAVKNKFYPPCTNGDVELRMSFAVMPNDVFPKITIRPRRNDQLIAWPRATSNASPQATNSQPSNNNAEIAFKIAAGIAKGLEDAKISKMAAGCEKSILVMAFAFSKEGPVKACKCFATEIVRGENTALTKSMVERIEGGQDFDEEIDRIAQPKVEQYLERCISS